jgi:CheY-like chemotaxis protein
VKPQGRPLSILMVEDDSDDRVLAMEAFRESGTEGTILFVEDGDEMMEHFRHSSLPDLILMDLNMPRKDGREALRELKAHPQFRVIPVVILTTSKSQEDIDCCLALGARSYIVKPSRFEALVGIMTDLQRYRNGSLEISRAREANSHG